MNTVSIAKARNEFAEILNRAAYGKERVALTRRGRIVGAVVPQEDLELLEELEDRLDLDDARRALKEARGGKTVAWNHLKKELGI